MSKNYSFEFENDEMAFFVDESIAVLKLKGNFLTKISDIEKSGKYFTVIDWLEKDPVVNSLLIFNEDETFSNKSYCQFMDLVFTMDKEEGKYKLLPEKKLYLVRQIHTIRILIQKILHFEKPVVFCLRGNISTLGFSLSLAADYRFAIRGTTFSFPNKQYCFPPIGGLPYLLPMFVGKQLANSMIYKGKDIDSATALDLKLINEIFPEEDFENKCIEYKKNISLTDENFCKITKKLNNHFVDDLEEYFNFESKISGF